MTTKRKKGTRPPCAICAGHLNNLKRHICSFCEKAHGPFKYNRWGERPEWYKDKYERREETKK